LFFKSPPALILASTSTYRRELLRRLGVSFECVAPGVDETRHPGECALDLVARLAREKAGALARGHPDAWVIGSDQVAVWVDSSKNEMILGKPGTTPRCIEQLQRCSGQTIAYLSAVALRRSRDAALLEFVDTTRVAFRVLDQAAIERYVAKESPLDCAGGFKSEGLGITLCESIDSTDPTALVGLPLIRLSAALRGVGFDLP
jgi:septum formation protein